MTDDESPSGAALNARVAACEDDLQDLQARLDRVTGKVLPLLTATLRRVLDVDIEDLSELPTAGVSLHARLTEVEARVATLEMHLDRLGETGGDQTTEEQKIAAMLMYAENKRDARQSTVAVWAPEIKGCVGVARRYAYDLVDEITADVAGCRVREATTVETSTGTKRTPKAVLVDCDAVHGDGGRVNSFTTGATATGSHATAEAIQEGDS